jgi:fatty acid desaturase
LLKGEQPVYAVASMTVPAITDPVATPNYAPSAFERWIEGLLYEARDAVFVRHTIKVTLLVLPLQVLLFARFSWWLAAVIWALQAVYAPPSILMLHNTMHRPFIKRWRILNRVHPYLMSALFGIPTGYMEHHIGMHHAENNLRADLSSTMKYQRDSFPNWLMYFARFLFLSHIDIIRYMVSHKRTRLGVRAVGSDLVHLTAMASLAAWVDWRASVAVLLGPYLVVRVGMMLGNWGQHAFLDASRPGDSYVNSITCINTVYNRRCFNDGYHIGHHVKQNRHWTELPGDFLANVDRYAREGCVVFEGLDFFFISILLFLKRYDVLARHFVRLPGDARTDAEVVEFLKTRTRRIPDDVPEGAVMNA